MASPSSHDQSPAPIAGLDWSRVPATGPYVMGIVNVTPDSFSDGGRFGSVEAAVDHALRLVDEGAHILDIGGESTRPGAEPVPLGEELARVVPVIEGIVQRTECLVSIDTRKSAVMRAAAEAGARVINDVSALTHDSHGLETVAALGLPVILMHAQGDPRTMQADPRYDDVVGDVKTALAERIAACQAAGIGRERIMVDPGIGFGKTLEHNLTLLANLDAFHDLGCAILLGASRKSFIGRLSKDAPADKRLGGSLATVFAAIGAGVQMVRVHDVAETVQALTVHAALKARRASPGRGL